VQDFLPYVIDHSTITQANLMNTWHLGSHHLSDNLLHKEHNSIDSSYYSLIKTNFYTKPPKRSKGAKDEGRESPDQGNNVFRTNEISYLNALPDKCID
jgi:hypothetical protein